MVLSKGIYSDEELELFFQNLFFEKKKVKELEQKLQILHQDHELLLAEYKQIKSVALTHRHSESEEIEKLKSLIATYKKKSAQAIHALYENEHQKIKQETTLAHQLRQLQANVQELSEENSALLEQQKTLRERYEQVKFEHSYKKSNEHKLSLESQLEQERKSNQALRAENQELVKNLSDRKSILSS